MLILAFALLSSCSNTYKEHQKIKDLKWQKTDIKTFEVNIKEDGVYNLFFTMRHSVGYPFTSIKIKIEQITPNEEIFEKNAEFAISDENGKYTGEVVGDLWDTENLFSENTSLKKGKYVFKISHAMNHDPVILVIDVGLVVKKVEK